MNDMKKKKILYIEDETDQRDIVKTIIEANGFEVIEAQDGEMGLKMAFDEKPHLILLDLTMPKVHGMVVLKRLKADAETKNIPVFILTASGEKDSEEKCRMAGADEFLRKPFDSHELMKRIDQQLKRKGNESTVHGKMVQGRK